MATVDQNVYQINAGAFSVNQGTYGAQINWKRIVALISTPGNYSITPAELSNLRTTWISDMITDPYNRIQIIGRIDGAKSTGAAPKQLTGGYGDAKTVYSGKYAFDFTFDDSNIIKHANRQKLNDKDDRKIILIDDNMNAAFTLGDDGTGLQVLQGFTLNEFYAQNMAMDEGGGVKQTVSVSFSDDVEFNKGNFVVKPIGFNALSVLKNVSDVYLVPKSTIATRVISIAPVDQQWGNTNLAAVYPTVIAGVGATSLWVVTDHATGTPLVVSSATKAVIDGVDCVTLTIAVTSFPTSGGSIDITLTTPALLAAAGIKYYEGNTLNVQIP